MIKSLKIQNFQSHAKTELEFSDGVNVIVGSSDSGKTAIIRALRWLVWNRPSGDAIRSTWGGETFAELSTFDSQTIIRSKDKADKYFLRQRDRDLEFKAFGTAVPEDIQAALNIQEVNLQGQLDAPFLLSNSPGERAQYFNKVASLDKIDVGLQNVQREVRELDRTVKYKIEDIGKKESDLLSFEYLSKFEIEVEVLEEEEQRKISLAAGKNRFTSIVKSLEEIEEEITEEQALLSQEQDVNHLLTLYQRQRDVANQRAVLRRDIQDIQSLEDELSDSQELLSLLPLVEKSLAYFTQKAAIQGRLFPLRLSLASLFKIQRDMLYWQETAFKLEDRFHKEMPDVCPLCGRSSKVIIKGSDILTSIKRERK